MSTNQVLWMYGRLGIFKRNIDYVFPTSKEKSISERENIHVFLESKEYLIVKYCMGMSKVVARRRGGLWLFYVTDDIS